MAIQSSKTKVARRPVAVDLFAGAGGFSLGIEQAGFDILVAVEYDPIHACTYRFNFPLTEVLCADISTVTGDEIRQAAFRGWINHRQHCLEDRLLGSQYWDGQIDLVFGGPPCQGFSIMGNRELNDDRNHLIFHFYRLVTELNPRYFVMENVPGMAAGEHKKLLLELISKFEAAGYCVQQGILNAADFGVPQQRRRLFVVGTTSSANGQKEKELLGVCSTACSLTKAYVTVEDAIADLPNIDDFPELKTSDEVLLSPSQLASLNQKCSSYVQRLRYSKFLQILDQNRTKAHKAQIKEYLIPTLPSNSKEDFRNFSYPRLWNPLLLTSSMQTQHRESSKMRFAKTLPGELEPTSRLRRLDLKGLCHTLRAGTDRSRGSHTSPRPIHPTLPRVISVREAARLSSFPDWFRFHQTKWHGFRQVGNAVPPLLAQAIGEKLIAALEVEPFVPQTVLELGDTQLLRLTLPQARNYWHSLL